MPKVKNYAEFQHFKDRSPPWIKLYKTILDRRDINALSDKTFRILVGLWLLASEDKDREGNLPEIADIAYRLRRSESDINNAFQELGSLLVNDDIAAISGLYQDSRPETERETETEEDISIEFDVLWKAYPSAQPKGAKNQALKKFIKIRKKTPLQEINEGLLRYSEYCKSTGSYNKHMETWLNQEGWKEEWSHQTKKLTDREKAMRQTVGHSA